MKTFTAKTSINAPMEKIWDILTDAPRYPMWDPNCERLEGVIALGGQLIAHSKLAVGRAFPVKVTEFDPGKKMVWTGGMPLGLFKGTRTFTLRTRTNGSIEFVIREDFTGPLVPFIASSLPDLDVAFKEFAAGLKDRAERSDEERKPYAVAID